METEIKTKRCIKCNRILPITSFGKKSSAKDGLSYQCKECINSYNRENREKNLLKKIKSSDNLSSSSSIHKVFSNPDLAKFTSQQLIKELKERGYTGELKYVQRIKL